MKTGSFSDQYVISHTRVDSVFPIIHFEPFRVRILLIHDKNTILCSSKDIVPISISIYIYNIELYYSSIIRMTPYPKALTSVSQLTFRFSQVMEIRDTEHVFEINNTIYLCHFQ